MDALILDILVAAAGTLVVIWVAGWVLGYVERGLNWLLTDVPWYLGRFLRRLKSDRSAIERKGT